MGMARARHLPLVDKTSWSQDPALATFNQLPTMALCVGASAFWRENWSPPPPLDPYLLISSSRIFPHLQYSRAVTASEFDPLMRLRALGIAEPPSELHTAAASAADLWKFQLKWQPKVCSAKQSTAECATWQVLMRSRVMNTSERDLLQLHRTL
jgi:hypothetical protein